MRDRQAAPGDVGHGHYGRERARIHHEHFGALVRAAADELLACSRISGPLLDRIDIQVEVRPVQYRDLIEQSGGESSATLRTPSTAPARRSSPAFAAARSSATPR